MTMQERQIVQGRVLWTPPADARRLCEVGRYLDWLEGRGLAFADYDELHRWSVTDLEGFWGSLWDFFEVRAHGAVRAGARLATRCPAPSGSRARG